MAFNTDQQRYRFYADGAEASASPLAAQNTNIVADISGGNVNLLLRSGIQEIGGSSAVGQAWHIECSRNGGAYATVTTSTAGVRAFDSASLTDGAATTERLTGATGVFEAAKVSEAGTIASVSPALTANNHTELLFALQLVAADFVRDGETLAFHVFSAAGQAQPVFTVVPRIVVALHPEQRFFGMFFA